MSDRRWSAVIYLLTISLVLFSCVEISTARVSEKSADTAEVYEQTQGIRPVFVDVSKMQQRIETQSLMEVESERRQSVFEMYSEPSERERIIPQHSTQIDSAASDQLSLTTSTAPTLLGKYSGTGVTGFDPPDPILGVGPSNVMTAVNSVVAIYTKTGQRQFQTSFRNWFASLRDSRSAGFFDCKVIYDQYNDHFIVMSLAVVDRTKIYCFFSVSKTSDATGNWAMWDFDLGVNGTTQTSLQADFPGLGLDPQAVYLTANMFSGNTYRYAKIRVFKKTELYSFGALTWKDFVNFSDISGQKAINVQPAQCFGTTPVEYLISDNAVQGSRLTLYTIVNPTLPSATLMKKGVSVSTFRYPPPAPQKGGPLPINTGDAGVVNVVFSGGYLYTAHAILHNFGGGNVAAIRFYQISTTGQVVHEITYGANGLFYYYPATMADSRGNVVIVFNRSGANQFAGILYTGKLATDPQAFAPSKVLQQGLTYYYNEPHLNLWGDYNGIALDSDDSIWLHSEFTQKQDSWATKIGHVRY